MTERDVVLVTSRTFASASVDYRAALTDDGVEVVLASPDHDLAALSGVLPRVTEWVAGVGPVTEAHLALAGRLRLVARYGTGVDNVDLAAARRRGVLVSSTPGANADAVADFALTMVLAGVNGLLPAGTRTLRRSVASTVAGLWGLGQVGARLSTRLSALGVTVLAHDPHLSRQDFDAVGAQPCEVDDLAQRCDVVSLHLPGGSPVVTASWLARVRGRPVLVNTARSSVVDPEALAGALRAGVVSAYLSDVDDERSLTAVLADDRTRGRVLLTPHLAAHTREAVDETAATVYRQVRASMSGQVPPGLVRDATGFATDVAPSGP